MLDLDSSVKLSKIAVNRLFWIWLCCGRSGGHPLEPDRTGCESHLKILGKAVEPPWSSLFSYIK